MKIIFLNAWRGNIPKIKEFILEHKSTTDIFCFQESWNSKSEIFCLDWLKDYQHFFDYKKVSRVDHFSNTTFISSNFKVNQVDTIGLGDLKVGLGLFTQINTPKGKINICNVHGHARPGNKQDTPARIKQSQIIIDFIKNFSGPKLIGGDFNLDRDIKSTQMFEQSGYISLIKHFNIKSTRNEISWENYSNKQYFADHLFVSPDIKVNNFSVPYNEVSDHLPLILDFEI